MTGPERYVDRLKEGVWLLGSVLCFTLAWRWFPRGAVAGLGWVGVGLLNLTSALLLRAARIKKRHEESTAGSAELAVSPPRSP